MTIRNVNLGGTDWASGNILLSADLNETVRAATMRSSASGSDAAEYTTTTNTAWSDLGFSETFTPPTLGARNIVHALRMNANIKVAADRAFFRLKVVNDTTSRFFYVYRGLTNTVETLLTTASSTYAVDDEVGLPTMITTATTIEPSSSMVGATYTVTIEARTDSASRLISIKDIVLTIHWTAIEDAVTEGWA